MTTALFRDDSYLRSCQALVLAADERGIRLDHTVFYPQGGGQPGDTGTLRFLDGRTVQIIDTRKGDGPEEVLHIPAPDAPLPSPGDAITADIDWERRYRLMRMHSCLHLLCALVPGAVTGGQISDGRGRLDFDTPGDALDRDDLTRRLNEMITTDHPVTARWITDAELGARPELVRTMSVTPPIGQGRVRLLDIEGVDLQPCGGTHIRRTGEIGCVAVTKIENKGKQNRRVIVGFTG